MSHWLEQKGSHNSQVFSQGPFEWPRICSIQPPAGGSVNENRTAWLGLYLFIYLFVKHQTRQKDEHE